MYLLLYLKIHVVTTVLLRQNVERSVQHVEWENRKRAHCMGEVREVERTDKHEQRNLVFPRVCANLVL